MDQLLNQLGEVFAPFHAQIMHSKRPNIQLHLSPSNTLALWDSKIGGIPYLPVGQPYPSNPETGNKLQLIAQINFAQLPSNDVYPSTGILQFFLDASDQLIGLNLNQPTEQTTFRVVFHEQVIEDASQLQNLDDLDLSAYIQYSPIHNQSRIQFVPSEQYIGLQDHDFAPLILGAENLAAAAKTWHGRDFNTEFVQPYQAALNQPDPHHLGGYPNLVGQDPRSPHPELQDYVLLLQLSSDTDNGIGVFWDNYSAGQFFIHPDDLKNKDFSKVMYYWSSTQQ